MGTLIEKRMKGKQNSNGLDKNKTNINVDGRPISFKNEFKKLLDADGSLKIAKENIQSINDDGSVTLKVAKKDAMVMKALGWAMSNKGTESTKMLVWIMEMFDGKAVQKVETKGESTISISKEDSDLLNNVL